MSTTELTQARLMKLLHYAPLLGEFRWLERPIEEFSSLRAQRAWNARYAGTLAGGLSGDGYISIRVVDRAYWAHRLAWLYMTGEWPTDLIRHSNRVITCNRWDNLVEGSRSSVAQSLARSPRNKRSAAPLGVHFNARLVSKPFSASVRRGGVPTHLGYFSSALEAHNAYVEAKRAWHPGSTI